MRNEAKQFISANEEYELYKKQKEQREAKAPPKLIITQKKGVSVANNVKLCLCIVMGVMLLSLSLFHNVAVVELGDRIADQTATYNILVQEGNLMQSRLDSEMSLSAVAEVTRSKMLMSEAENHQITYINLNLGDVEVKPTSANELSFWERVLETIDKLKEYYAEQ